MVCRSVAWVKKWKKRWAGTEAADDRLLSSQSRARQHPPEKISAPVVDAILEIRDQPPDEQQPVAVRHDLKRISAALSVHLLELNDGFLSTSILTAAAGTLVTIDDSGAMCRVSPKDGTWVEAGRAPSS